MQIHGSWDIKRLAPNILGVKIIDAWNVEAALAFSKELKEIVQPFLGNSWAILLSAQQADSVGPPNVIPVVQELNQWCIDNGCRCEAHIVRSGLQRQYNELTRSEKIKQLPVPACPTETTYTHAYFDSLESALAFLAQNQFYIDAEIAGLPAWFNTNPHRHHF